MTQYSNRPPRRSRVAPLVAFLSVTLMLSAGLAYNAQDAARSHRATAEATLRDYASIAAWEFSRRAREQTTNAILTLFSPLQKFYEVRSVDELPTLTQVLDIRKTMAVCDCPGIKAPHTYFQLDMASGEFTTFPDNQDRRQLEQLADTLALDLSNVPNRFWGMFAYSLRRDSPVSDVLCV